LAIVGAATIGVIFAGIGVFREQIFPLIKINNEIKRRRNELFWMNDKIKALQDTSNPIAQLDEADKHALMKLIEDYLLLAKSITRKGELANLKVLIARGQVNLLLGNKLLNDALADKLTKLQPARKTYSIYDCLIDASNARSAFLNNKLTQLRKAQTKRTAFLVNSIISLCGAALLVVPFPPVMILGASILFVTTIVSLAIKYNWLGKFKAYISRKSAKPVAATAEEASDEETLSHTQSLTEKMRLKKSQDADYSSTLSKEKDLSETSEASSEASVSFEVSTSEQSKTSTENSSLSKSGLSIHAPKSAPSSKEESSEEEKTIKPSK
jgi:hypothetical protein